MDTNVYVILCCLVLVRDASGSCGALTIMRPTFVNRKVTLKFIPHNQWITDIVWKYTPGLDEARKYAVEGLKRRFQQTVQYGPHSHTILFYADKSCNNSKFHVQCSNQNDVTRSNTVKIHLHEIRPKCGNLVLLSPEIKYGTNVEIAYYPSDALVEENGLHNARTWLNGLRQPVYLRNNTFEEKKMSDYLYTLNIHNFMEKDAGRYALQCRGPTANTTNWLHIYVTDKPLIGPIMDDCVYGNADTIIYCNTSRTRGKPRVTLSIGSEVITMLENETQPGVYTVVLDANTWRDNDGHIVTCKVSNDDYVHDLNSSAKLVNMVNTQPVNLFLDKVQNSTPYFDSTTGDNSTRSFKFSLEPILIGTGAFVVLCIFVASARTLVLWLKGRSRTSDPGKAEVTSAIEVTHSLDTNEYVDMPETSMHMNAAHDFEDNYVELKIREDSMMARKPITAMKSKYAKSSLIYADLDIDQLQKACVAPIPEPRPNRQKEATVYQDINFSNTRPAVPH